MKTNEFVKIANELGYKTLTNKEMIAVKEPNTLSTVLRVSNKTELSLDTQFDHSALNKHKLENLIIYAVELARTTIEDREEKKKYIYKLPVKNLIREKSYLLRYSDTEVRFDASSKSHVLRSPTYHFTDVEVETYPEDIQALFKACNKELVE